MQPDHTNQLKAWFDAYTRSFLTHETNKDSPLVLKIKHTARVCANICQLGRSIDLTDAQMRIAETVGLFHDVGRFEQYTRYQTFNDRKSVNHAALGIDVLNRATILDPLPADEKAMIVDAIRFHNSPALPQNRPPASMIFMHLIRDADKLDIWKVFADYFRDGQAPDPAIVQHLSDSDKCSDDIIHAILQKRVAKFKEMKSVNDFKLLQLSWVFDLNFPETFSLAKKRGDLVTIADSLPDHRVVRHAIAGVMNQLERNN